MEIAEINTNLAAAVSGTVMSLASCIGQYAHTAFWFDGLDARRAESNRQYALQDLVKLEAAVAELRAHLEGQSLKQAA